MPAVASLSPSPRGRDRERTEGSGNAASAHLLGVRVPVISQARVGQHEPVLLPLPADRLGGGSGKDRRETDRRLPREAQEQGGTCCSATSQPPGSSPFSGSLPTPPCAPQLRAVQCHRHRTQRFPTVGETETGGEGKTTAHTGTSTNRAGARGRIQVGLTSPGSSRMDIHPFLKLRRSGWRREEKAEGYCVLEATGLLCQRMGSKPSEG